MARLYVFGIGGTGARVIKSLTMLLAAGLNLGDYELIPILVDPDQANGDLNRTTSLLETYQRIRSQLEFQHNQFFQTPSTPLPLLNPQATNQLSTQGYNFKIQGSQTTFRNFIGYQQLSSANQGLMDLLYTEDNLNAQMDVGFKGNPNMGSIVLNQIQTSIDFLTFASAFQPVDRIFIVSSIFGGTGAAGFPLLVNNIRSAGASIPNFAFLQQAVIGALTVLPYFTLNQGQQINANTFVSKTIAALSYYDRNMNAVQALNAMYYIGDSDSAHYDNNVGGQLQQNKAHFVELAGALAIIDFAQIASQMPSGATRTTSYKEFGVSNGKSTLHFSDLGPSTQIQLKKSLSQFKYFGEYLRLELNQSIGNQPVFTTGTRIGPEFMTRSFYKDLNAFHQQFNEWIAELEDNNISFAPFRSGTDQDNLFSMLNGIDANGPGILNKLKGTENFNYYNKILQEVVNNGIDNLPTEQKFGAAFFKATEMLMSKRFNC